jgi:signal peptidase II
VAQLFPPDGGYTGFLYGKVVDMFYFPIIDTVLPEWVPFYGGEHFIFFRPIFNFADACISVSVIYMLLFQRKFFKEEK